MKEVDILHAEQIREAVKRVINTIIDEEYESIIAALKLDNAILENHSNKIDQIVLEAFNQETRKVDDQKNPSESL